MATAPYDGAATDVRRARSLELVGPLCDAAVRGNIRKVEHLIEMGADANLGTPHDERTPLHLAAAGGHLSVVKLLVETASAVLKRDRYGMLPIHDAVQCGHTKVRAYLQEVEFAREEEQRLGEDKDHPFAEQRDTVFNIVVRDGIFSYQSVQTQVQYYYKGLGLHPTYFESFTAAQIAKHVQGLMAAARSAETRGERDLRFKITDDHSGFFLSTLARGASNRMMLERCSEYIEQTISSGQALSLTFMASEAPYIPLGGKDERLSIHVVDRNHWERPLGQRDVDLRDETDLNRVATASFLRKESQESLALHQRLIERALSTRSLVVEVFSGADFPGPYPGGFVVYCATYESGERRARPLFLELQELLWRAHVQPKRVYIETFANGAATYGLFLPDAKKDSVHELVSSLRFVQHLKRTPGRSQVLFRQVMDGVVSPEVSVYLLAGVKFCSTFFPREKYVPQYGQLQGMLRDSESRTKLDSLFLQTMSEIIVPERIYEIVERHIHFANRLFEDFRKIGTGECRPFLNHELERDILESARDPFSQQVLRMFLLFNQSIMITNFFRTDQPPAAIAFRLDPAPVLAGRPKSLYPSVPFGIYLLMGKAFYGFHVRFREIARGGVRIVRSRDRQMYDKNASTLFEECYNLAYTQQLKNKDIPEGGSKGVILLDSDRSLGLDTQSVFAGRDCFLKYFDAILDCMLRPPGVSSHCANDELIFLGPDEGTADCMDLGARRAQERGYQFWRAMTTGKSVELGGVPHDTYGITTRGVRTYVTELLRALELRQEDITKVQTGGPDGDLGSNEILQSRERLVALVDVSGVAYDPAGLDRNELVRLAQTRSTISSFNRSFLGDGGFLVLTGDKDITLPDGTQWRTGVDIRDGFLFTPYARADLLVPCGGRPATINASNVGRLLAGDAAAWRMIVEGANLFITEDARRLLEDAGVHVFKDSSANKGGVTSSSLEVFASLAVPPEEFDQLLTAKVDAAEPPAFYREYVECILERIEENCRDEFHVIWEANQNVEGDSKMLKSDASRRLSLEITSLQDHIAAAELDEGFIRQVLPLAIPPPILRHCGLEGVLARVPRPYVKAIVAYWLASKYIYKHGLAGANAFAFHEFMRSSGGASAGAKSRL